MFKVQENKDGSTSVFCKATGKLICRLGGNQRPDNNRRISHPSNALEPSPRVMPPNLRNDLQSGFHTDEQAVRPNTRESTCRISPLPVYVQKEEKEDYYDDCITQDEFARCLNLIPKAKLASEGGEKLKAEFPLRYLSRTQPSEVVKYLKEAKLRDDTPLTSSLGLKILHLNPQKNFFNEQAVQESINKYDVFCRFPVNTTKLISGNFPKLRCREKKDYPITVPLKILRLGEAHTYCFTRRQRLEKMITRKTGLDARSRRLHHLCSKRQVVVYIKRLTETEIAKWTERQSESSPSLKSDSLSNKSSFSSTSTDSCTETSDSDSDTSDSDSDFRPGRNRILQNALSSRNIATSGVPSFKGYLPRSTKPKPLTYCNSQHPRSDFLSHFDVKQYENCYVKLTNVLEKLHKIVDTYFIRGTAICVPFYADYLNDLKLKSLLKVNHKKANCQFSVTTNDHAYHRPFPKQNSKSIHNVRISCYLDSSKKGKCHVRIKSEARNSIPKVSAASSSSAPATVTLLKNPNRARKCVQKKRKVKMIPVVDLTDENVPEPVSQTQFSAISGKYPVSKWLFHCFGCGHKCLFFAASFLDTAVTEHMQIYHSVSDPGSFLHSYYDSGNLCAIIEAFPGYKVNLGNGEL